jgi:hypothetical protein
VYRSIRRVLLSLLVVLLAALVAPATEGASPVAAASYAPAVPKPCGIRHYPPCPPKSSFAVYPRRVHRGHRVTISVQHYRAYTRIIVNLAGHGRYIYLGSSKTGRRGNRTFSVVIPRRIPVGRYLLYVRIGWTIKAVGLSVLR